MMASAVGTTGAGAMFMDKDVVADCCGELESTAVTPKLKLPLAAGVPVRTPVLAERVRPAGSCPEEMLQVYGEVPPVAAMVAAYGALMAPWGRAEVVIASAAGGVVPGAATTTGTDCDSFMVCVFCTCS